MEKAVYLSTAKVEFPDKLSGVLVSLFEVNYLPVDSAGNIGEPKKTYTRAVLPPMNSGNTYDFVLSENPKTNKKTLVGVLNVA